MRVVLFFCLILANLSGYLENTAALDNGMGITPQMGWNSWNLFGCDIDESLIEGIIKEMVSGGLKDIGYTFVNLDDCWQTERLLNGTIVADKDRFPNGIASLADLAHENGLFLGVYSDAGNKTCQGRPGSLGYEQIDAQTYANWGVDYLKYDNCYNEHILPTKRYPIMRDALNATGRPIFYSICEWGREMVWKWGPETGNSWRTTMDISDHWHSMLWNWDHNGPASAAGPGAWNDPDMLEVGNGGMTEVEYRSHFSLWAIAKAPLIIGCDIRNMDNSTRAILTNTEIIAVNQDSLGLQASKVKNVGMSGEIFAGQISGDSYAVAFFNRGSGALSMTLEWSDLSIDANAEFIVRDLWLHKNVANANESYTTTVDSHATVMVKLIPA